MALERFAALAIFALPLFAQHGSISVVNPYTGPEHRQAGAALFRSQCAGCHGPDGRGTGAGPNLAADAFAHGGSDEALFRAISKGFPGTSMPAFALSGLETWQLVTHLRALAIAHGATVGPGDAAAGAVVFRSHCARCHSVNGEGAFTAPDLSDVAVRQSRAEMRESILDPDAQVASPYWSVTATTATGKTLRGVRLNEDTFSIQLRDPEGRLVSLAKRDLASYEVTRRSPMPGFRDALSERQVDDVIAWLISVRRAQ
jgi:putative heme-binding domain-containing protein